MEIFKQIAPLRTFLEGMKRGGKTIGLVPTMGALHQGHISLVSAAKSHNSVVVASIYVNPAQFNNPDDLIKYPRKFEEDVDMLQKAGCDVIFAPNDDEMYLEAGLINIAFGHLEKVMEGKYRPGHFSGVALVVSKLFNIVQPDMAFFGQKDWQQFAVIRRLVDELKFNLELRSVPIVRESDGLAMSSRNLRLTAEQRQHASIYYRALIMAKISLQAGDSLADVKEAVKGMVDNEPGMSLQYFEVADSKDLTLLGDLAGVVNPIMCIAGHADDVRLIDNMFLE